MAFHFEDSLVLQQRLIFKIEEYSVYDKRTMDKHCKYRGPHFRILKNQRGMHYKTILLERSFSIRSSTVLPTIG
jgi:hypothetical protein